MVMRITDSYMSSLMVKQMHRALADMLTHQERAATGRRINSYSDDPRGVGSIHRYRSLLDSNEQYATNIQLARGVVEAGDSAMQQVSDVLMEVRELVMRESSALGTATSRVQAVEEVDSLVNKLIGILNVTVEGSHIFGGHRTGQPPFVMAGGVVTYQGDDNPMITQIGPSTQMEVSLPGSEFLGTNNAILTGLEPMSPQLELTTNLSDLNVGQGWTSGAIRITDGNADVWGIDLTAAVTVGDVLTEINAQSGGVLTATISPDGRTLQVSGPGPLTIEETTSEGMTAQSLGLRTASDSGTLVGRDIRVAPDMTTALADIPSLNGLLPLDGILVSIDQVETFVDFSGALTLGDLRTALTGAIPGLDLQIEGSVLSVISNTARPFVISNNGGTNTANILGMAGVGNPGRLFGMFEDLTLALQTGDTAGIQNTLGEISGVESTVMAKLIRVGGWENTLDWMDSLLQERDERLSTNLSQVQDADISKVATDLAKAESAYEATLLVTSKMFNVNLMSYLR